MKQVVGIICLEAMLILAGVEIGKMPELSPLLRWGGIGTLLIISTVLLLWNARSENKRREAGEKAARADSKKIDAVLKALNGKAQGLPDFMMDSHSWRLGDVGWCAKIPDGSHLIKLRGGNYLISDPVGIVGKGSMESPAGAAHLSRTDGDDDR